MPDTKIGIGRALIDAEEHLSGVDGVGQRVEPVMLDLAALKPAQRPFARRLGIVILRGIFHALVKRHGNIAAEI